MRFGSLFTTAFFLTAYSFVITSGMHAFSATPLLSARKPIDLEDLKLAQEFGENNGPEIIATAAFSDQNTFNRKLFHMVADLSYPDSSAFCQDVVNGEKNTLTLTLENKSNRNVTLLNVAGALLHPDTNALLKNVRGPANTPPLLLTSFFS
jgi:hypothetical protein